MKNTVIIKSFPNGISLILDETMDFEALLEQIGIKFRDARGFFKDAGMALSIEGREITEAEEIRVLEAIRANCDINIICLIEHDGQKNKNFVKALKSVEKHLAAESDGQFIRGSLKNGEVMEIENNVVILGDVYPGSKIISTKNIIVLGGLYGEAYAGGGGKSNTYVVALEMSPEKLKIGDFKYIPKTKPKWGLRPKIQPKIAYIKDKNLVMEPLTKEILGSF